MKIFGIKPDLIILVVIAVFTLKQGVELYWLFTAEGFSTMWNSQLMGSFLGWFYGLCATGQILILEEKLEDATSR